MKAHRGIRTPPAPEGPPLAVSVSPSVPEALQASGPRRIVPAMSSSAARDGARAASDSRETSRDVPVRSSADLTAVAEALGIPWERLLEAEIHAERTLRGFVGEADADVPFWRLLSALPATALDSWRVRERLAQRVRDARLMHSGAALRAIREAIDELCGRGTHSTAPADEALAVHLAHAHERVRELARVARAAERIRGEKDQRSSRLVERTGCTPVDAAWALARAESPERSHAIDDAVRQARAEGFEIPVEDSEFHSFLALRKLARRHPPKRRRGRRIARRHHPSLRPSHRLAS